MDEELKAIESQLEQLSPSAMPDDMLRRMEQAMEKWQDSVPSEEKIIAFNPVPTSIKSLQYFNSWASVAALVLISLSSYIVFNLGSAEETDLLRPDDRIVGTEFPKLSGINADNVISANNSEFGTQVKKASTNIVTDDLSGKAMRVMQVELEDIVIIHGTDGKIYKTRQPRVEYYAVPVKMY